MSRAGISRATGAMLYGWDHCVQSIGVILTTRVGSRVMRRAFGAGVKQLQDANATRRTFLEVYRAVHKALTHPRYGEPGFRLLTIDVDASEGVSGTFKIILDGVFYPNGHLGDYSESETRRAILPISERPSGVVAVVS